MPDERKDNDDNNEQRDREMSDGKTSRNKESSEKEDKHQEYDEWNREDLMLKAGELGIEGRSKMDKQGLIKAIRNQSLKARRACTVCLSSNAARSFARRWFN